MLERTVGWLDEGDDALTIGTRLRREGLSPTRASAVAGAAAARIRARARWEHADRLLFTTSALQQASDPAVSRWRADRFRDVDAVTDLCAGIGGDALAIAAHTRVLALDLDRARASLLTHNRTVLGRPVDVVVADVLEPPVPIRGLVHVDPSRRRGGRRARALADYRPSIPALLDRWRDADGLGIVVSPAVALDDPDAPDGGELEFVQVGRDLVEAVWWTGELARTAGTSATILPDGAPGGAAEGAVEGVPEGVHRVRSEGGRLPVGPVGAWLLEVAPAAVRARCHDAIGAEVGARRIARSRALLTTDADPGASPWWTRWQVEAVLPAHPRQVRRWLRDAPAQPLEIAIHGVAVDPVTWWQELGRPSRGTGGRRIHLIRTDDGAVAVASLTVAGPEGRDGADGR